MAGMGTAAIIVSAVSSAAQAANNYMNYSAQADAAKTNAKIAENNQRATLTESMYAQDAKAKQGQQYISNQYVRNLQSGASGAGTTGDNAVAKSVYNLQQDLNMTAYNYQTKATDYLNQSKMYQYQSGIAKANAANALISGGLNIGNNILAGAGKTKVVDSIDSDTARWLNRPAYAKYSNLWL